MTKRTSAPPKTPLRWPGILFAFAANTLAVTLTDSLVRRLSLGLNAETLATVVAPLLAGMATALYTGSRGGMHARRSCPSARLSGLESRVGISLPSMIPSRQPRPHR